MISDPKHLCHAKNCTRVVPSAMLMCPQHWRMVPWNLQAQVWARYVPGQETRKDPSNAYLRAARAAIEAVAEKEAQRAAEGC